MPDNFLIDSLLRYVGQTVTIFTTSGGVSGCGFTGVLASVCGATVKLITDIGAAPACPVGSSCGCNYGGYGNNCGGGYGYGGYGCGGYGYGGYGYGGYGYGGYGYGGCNTGSFYGGYNYGCNNWLGSVTEIPVYGTKYTLFVRLCSRAFQEFAWYRGLYGSRDKGLSLIRYIGLWHECVATVPFVVL